MRFESEAKATGVGEMNGLRVLEVADEIAQ
jgi:hypothetical protein